MDAVECIVTRRSIRRFLDVPVDFETMTHILEAGALAPSSGNVQDWKFVVVTKKDLMKKLSEHSLGQECVHNAAFLVVICCEPATTERHYGLRGQRLYTIQNCAAAAENMLLMAHALGLGGTWVGAFDEEKVREILNIEKWARPQSIMAFGYPDEIPDHKSLKDLHQIVFFNSYGTRYKKPHHITRDYSLDWEARINQAHSLMDKVTRKTQKATKKTTEKASRKGSSLFQKYKEEFKKSIKTKKK